LVTQHFRPENTCYTVLDVNFILKRGTSTYLVSLFTGLFQYRTNLGS